MQRLPLRCLFGLLAALILPIVSGEAVASDACDRLVFEDAGYSVCTVDPAADDLRLFWRDADGAPYRRFDRLADDLDRRGETLRFALNAGMYTPEFMPLGLYIEQGETLRALDTRRIDAPPAQTPNFYKRPSGVFFVHRHDDADQAAIFTTAAFADADLSPRLATQSGPMLVIDDRLHPALIEGSSSRTRRSGVGVCADGRARFAISDGAVNFHEFARLFRDRLGCANALFLDGGRGAGLYSPALERNDASWHGGYGPIVGVVETATANDPP